MTPHLGFGQATFHCALLVDIRLSSPLCSGGALCTVMCGCPTSPLCSSGRVPRLECLGHVVILCVTEQSPTLSTAVAHLMLPPAVDEGSSVPHSCQHVLSISAFNMAALVGTAWSLCGFDLLISNAAAARVCVSVWAICLSSFERCHLRSCALQP